MKNFRIINGDLALGVNGRVDMVRGAEKLGQDLTLWTLEPLGIGYTTPSFGSILDTHTDKGEHRFIGQVITEQVVSEIQAEVDRILNVYQQTQMEKIKIAQLRGELPLFQKSEILNEIVSISAHIPNEETTAVVVEVEIVTAAGAPIRLAILSKEDEGVSVKKLTTEKKIAEAPLKSTPVPLDVLSLVEGL